MIEPNCGILFPCKIIFSLVKVHLLTITDWSQNEYVLYIFYLKLSIKCFSIGKSINLQLCRTDVKLKDVI